MNIQSKVNSKKRDFCHGDATHFVKKVKKLIYILCFYFEILYHFACRKAKSRRRMHPGGIGYPDLENRLKIHATN